MGRCDEPVVRAAHSGLKMLADFQPDVLKIDMALTRAINTNAVRYEIARAIIGLGKALHTSVVAEDVETIDEAVTLRELGVQLFQGYLVAKPVVEQLPGISGETIDAIRVAHETKLLEEHFVGLGRCVTPTMRGEFVSGAIVPAISMRLSC